MGMFAQITFTPTPPHLHWRYVPIAGGAELLGWFIGPLVPAVVHYVGTSKPCRAAMTGGVMKCRHCSGKCKARVVGYQPIFTKEKEKVVVMCSAGVAPGFKNTPHGTPVRLYRSEVPCSPLKLTMWDASVTAAHTTAAIQKWKPVDIEPWLLHLWKDDTLTRYFAKVKRQETEAKSVDISAPQLPLALGAAPPIAENTVTTGTPLIRRGRKPKQ